MGKDDLLDNTNLPPLLFEKKSVLGDYDYISFSLDEFVTLAQKSIFHITEYYCHSETRAYIAEVLKEDYSLFSYISFHKHLVFLTLNILIAAIQANVFIIDEITENECFFVCDKIATRVIAFYVSAYGNCASEIEADRKYSDTFIEYQKFFGFLHEFYDGTYASLKNVGSMLEKILNCKLVSSAQVWFQLKALIADILYGIYGSCSNFSEMVSVVKGPYPVGAMEFTVTVSSTNLLNHSMEFLP